MAQRGVQGGRGRQRGRLRWFAGAHHPRQGEQQGIEQAGAELLHPGGDTPEGEALLHRPAAAGGWQQVGMEGIDANTQGLDGMERRSHDRGKLNPFGAKCPP